MFIIFIIFYLSYIYLIDCIIYKNDDKIIISLISDHNNIRDTIIIINSIINQKINKDLYKIFLIFQDQEYDNCYDLPNEIQLFERQKYIEVEFVKEKLTYLNRISKIQNKYANNAILIINDICTFPNGWLEMFIKDHIKYPKDAIASSIQYFFGKNAKITEFSEGFKGSKFGIFNHVTEMIFNFAIINIDLGGILYPKNFFQNSTFHNIELYLKSSKNSDDFWQSAFIIIEDKNLRQSSKIFDYTKYIINDTNYKEIYANKKACLEKAQLKFSEYFPEFNELVFKRQNKIIVSMTSYPQRFIYLPELFDFIRNQTFHINNIYLSLYKSDIKYYNFNISDLKIISADKNLKPHLKYFYSMKLNRNYAIITIDDDLGYSKDTFESLYNAYIENPNVICGRRAHLMTFKKNGELKSYYKWNYRQKLIKNPNFNLTLTNVGGTIFPPDILNINEEMIPIIHETISCDDLTLKYLANIKGIPQKWVTNNHISGVKRKLPKTNDRPLWKINRKNNDICINKLNLKIKEIFLKKVCTPYNNIQTGNLIYLFDIHNKYIYNNTFYFEIFAFSYCPMDENIAFNIHFDNYSSNCFLNRSNGLETNNNFINNVVCNIYNFSYILDLHDYYFPYIKTNNSIFINIYNYRKYSTHIFKQFICYKYKYCFLKILSYDISKYNKYHVSISDKQYLCKTVKQNFFHNIKIPYILDLKCVRLKTININNKIYISGIPQKLTISNETIDINVIPNQYIISRVLVDYNENNKQIIIIGKLINDLQKKKYNININLIYPKMCLRCVLLANSHYVQSKIYCILDKKIINEILIENQIVYLSKNNDEKELVLVNEETFIKIEFSKNILYADIYYYINEINNYFLFIILISLILIKMKKYIRKKKIGFYIYLKILY